MRFFIATVTILTSLNAFNMNDSDWQSIETEDGLKLRLFEPEKLESQSLPLIVFLHGSGERGEDNQKQLTHIAPLLSSDSIQLKYPSILLFPQCPQEDYWAPIDIVEGQWLTKTADQPTESLNKLIRFLEGYIESGKVDKSRIYMAGLSMGGFGTWDILSRKPEWFAAGIPICGGGDTTKVNRYSHIPIWTFHGSEDNVVPVELTRNTVEALRRYNAPIKYTEFEDVDHHSWYLAIEYPGLLEWLFEQKKH